MRRMRQALEYDYMRHFFNQLRKLRPREYTYIYTDVTACFAANENTFHILSPTLTKDSSHIVIDRALEPQS